MSERKIIIALLFFFLFHFISVEFVNAKTFSETNIFEKVYWIGGSVLITPVYLPLKALYTSFGVAASGAVLIGTAGFARDKAFSMVKSSIGGDWFIHPDYLMGNRKLNLFEPTVPAAAAPAQMPETTPMPGVVPSTPAPEAMPSAPAPSAPEITPAPQASPAEPAPEMPPAPSVSPEAPTEQAPGVTTLPETPEPAPAPEVTPAPETSTTPPSPETPSTEQAPGTSPAPEPETAPALEPAPEPQAPQESQSVQPPEISPAPEAAPAR